MKPEHYAKLFILFVPFVLGVWLGYFLASRTIRNNAIQQDCAYYNGKTGEFTWGAPQ